MNAMPNLDIICQKVVDCYKKIYDDKIRGIYLYGSYARGDFDEESDIDFAAIVEGEKVVSAEYFDKYFLELPYYRNILKEGKRLA